MDLSPDGEPRSVVVVWFARGGHMSERTTADGITAFTEVGQGPPLVLLHAFPLCRGMWQPQITAFGVDGLLQSNWTEAGPVPSRYSRMMS